mmetsp:Transcript_4368/g.3920  ORF Transcript_4368/g.3920 Transcript_4368/m.3920 type:complete len:147 (-) Transcript_4368:341-781(-)
MSNYLSISNNPIVIPNRNDNVLAINSKERRRLRVEAIKSKRNKTETDCSLNSLYSTNSDNVEIISDTKKELRKIRNRESAEASRKRKRDDINQLQSQVNELLAEVSYLKKRLSYYENNESNYNKENISSQDTYIITEPAAFKIIYT